MFGRNSISLFVTANSDKERLNWTKKIGYELSEITGGCHHLSGNGYWKNPETGVIDLEYSELLVSITDNPDDVFDQLRPVLWEYLLLTRQASLLVVTGDYAHYYDQDGLNYLALDNHPDRK